MQPNIIDLYHSDNAEKLPDFKTIAGYGIFAMVHKASQGNSYRDPRCLDRVKAAQDAGMLAGVYHFLTSEFAADVQAEFFAETIQSISAENVAIFVDYEKSKNTPALHQCVEFMKIAENNISGSLCGLYSSDLIRETLQPLAGGHQNVSMQAAETFFGSRRLWLAEYGPHENIPWPWSQHPEFCDMWQFNDHGRMKRIIGDVDFSVFTGGNINDLSTVWKTGRPQPSRSAAGAVGSSATNRGEMKTW